NPQSVGLSELLHVNDLFFFFQAEDGIRDGHVTGVQTCALPISFGQIHVLLNRTWIWPKVSRVVATSFSTAAASDTSVATASASRSEERRVGKECRFRWPR